MSDLDEARTSVFADEIVGFHVQQAAEKFLKAWLVLWSEPYPLTHNLARLLTLLQEKTPAAHNFAISTSTRLTQFSSVTTLWSPAPINREEAVQRLEALEQVRRRLAEVKGV